MMADPLPMHPRSLAQWLDQPVHTLKARWRFLRLPAMVVLVINIALAMSAQLLSGDMTALGPFPLVWQLLLPFGFVLTAYFGAAVSEAVATASIVEIEETGSASLQGVLKRAFAVPVLSAIAMRFVFHAGMGVASIVTCGLGFFGWLFAIMYLPLVLPAAMREHVGGARAIRRSMQLIWWRPQAGGPSTGSGGRVVAAYHVLPGLTNALSALPSLPTTIWTGLALWGKVVDGSFDPMSLSFQSQLTPPMWLILPVQVATAAVGVVVSFYGAQLFLDMHRDLVDAREGADFDRALDRLQQSSHDG